eukprot:gene45170-29422_t
MMRAEEEGHDMLNGDQELREAAVAIAAAAATAAAAAAVIGWCCFASLR